MSKTPYEIRLDVLGMAKEYLDSKYDAQHNTTTDGDNKPVEVSMYSPETLLEYAEKFYSFVAPNDDKQHTRKKPAFLTENTRQTK